MAKLRSMDLTEGPVLKKLLLFTIPIVLGNLLQQFYTVADRVVVGQFATNGATALAAIGATSSAINLIIGLFVGIATGNNVICANLLGARNTKDLRKSMHTSILIGLYCGFGLLVFGILGVPAILSAMGTPASIFSQASIYMRLYFVGVPASLVYNIGSGILRAHGDTRRPMFILMLSGLANVVLNLVLVLLLHLDVAGVAIATAISNYLSAGAVLWILFTKKDQYRLTLRELKLDKTQLLAVIRIGVPSGLGSVVFSASNVIIQSSVNSFDNAAIIAGRTVAIDINTLIYQIEGALMAACVSFAGQCYGAKKLGRIKKLAGKATLLSIVGMGIFIIPCVLFSNSVVQLFNQDPEVVHYSSRLQLIMNLGLFLYAPSEIFIGCTRGMKRAVAPTVLNIVAICGLRILWLWFIFPRFHTVEVLFLCYPASWLLSSIAQMIYFYRVQKKESKALLEEAKTVA